MATTNLNPLTELIPAKARKYVYAVAALAALLYGIFQAVDGDWKQFAAAVFATLVPALAASNTVSPESDLALEAAQDEAEAPVEDAAFDEPAYMGQHVAEGDQA